MSEKTEETKLEFAYEHPLTFDEERIKLGGRIYTIRQGDGDVRDQILDLLSSRTKAGPDGKPIGITTAKGLCAGVVTLGLFDDQDVRVPVKTISSWPGVVQEDLMGRVLKINKLDAKDAEQAKNE